MSKIGAMGFGAEWAAFDDARAPRIELVFAGNEGAH